MPSVTHDHSTVPPSKKRRRDGDTEHEAIQLPFSEQTFHSDNSEPFYGHGSTAPAAKHHPPHQSPMLVRKMMALCTPTKRQRVSGDGMDLVRCLAAAPSPARYTKSPIHMSAPKDLQETDGNNRPSSDRTIFERCHICNRKPTKKSDLDAFAICEGCGRRTCFICIRQCNGWQSSGGGHALHHNVDEENTPFDFSASITMKDVDEQWTNQGDSCGPNRDDRSRIQEKACQKQELRGWGDGHRERVCSGCCVERGADGDVVCLGCLAFVAG